MARHDLNHVPMGMAATPLVIGIPTFRRPELLRQLLQSLLPELRLHPAHVVVADNDCGSEAPAVVEAFRAQWPRIECIPVSERGVAQVRNAIVARALAVAPDWRWLVMLDDDGLATPGWLPRLLDAGNRFEGHLVGGPVEGVLPEDANLLARHSIFAARRRWATGVVPALNTTQNLGISRRTLALMTLPLFREAYGASGGEDYDLFRRTAQCGGRLVWCDEAVIREPAPPDRLGVKALLNRYATTGAYMAVIDRAYDGASAGWPRAFKGLASGLAEAALGALTFKGARFAEGVLRCAHFTGRIAGLAGVRTSRYVSKSTST